MIAYSVIKKKQKPQHEHYNENEQEFQIFHDFSFTQPIIHQPKISVNKAPALGQTHILHKPGSLQNKHILMLKRPLLNPAKDSEIDNSIKNYIKGQIQIKKQSHQKIQQVNQNSKQQESFDPKNVDRQIIQNIIIEQQIETYKQFFYPLKKRKFIDQKKENGISKPNEKEFIQVFLPQQSSYSNDVDERTKKRHEQLLENQNKNFSHLHRQQIQLKVEQQTYLQSQMKISKREKSIPINFPIQNINLIIQKQSYIENQKRLSKKQKSIPKLLQPQTDIKLIVEEQPYYQVQTKMSQRQQNKPLIFNKDGQNIHIQSVEHEYFQAQLYKSK